MLRTIIAVVLGYVVVVIFSTASALASWALFDAAGAFAEGSTVASTEWAISNCVFGFIAAIAAGVTAAAVGKHPTNLPVKILAGFILILGLVIAAFSLGVEPQPLPAGKPVADLTFVEAGRLASNPTWYLFVIPVIGLGGVLVGGKLVGRSDDRSQ